MDAAHRVLAEDRDVAVVVWRPGARVMRGEVWLDEAAVTQALGPPELDDGTSISGWMSNVDTLRTLRRPECAWVRTTESVQHAAFERWFGAFHLGGDWTSSDFQDYCAGLHSLWTDADAFPVKRARLAGVLSAWSGTADVLTALQRGAWLGALGVFVGLGAWARSLGGRWAVPFT